MSFGRLLTAMVTPFDENLQVNYEAAKALAKKLVDEGNDGIVICGSRGVSPTLTHDEKVNLFKAVKEAVGHRATLIAGTGSNNTADSILLTQEAEAIGMDGAMLVTPYYNKPPQEALYAHFKAIAESTNLKILLYNVPSRTSCNLEPETVARLAEIPNVVALKEAACDINQMTQLKSLLPSDFAIYSGDDSFTLPLMSLGAYGIVSVAGHCVGTEIKAMIEAFLAGDHDKALEIHLMLTPFFKDLFFITNPIPVKAAMNLQGIKAGGLRLPLIDPTEEDVKRVREGLLKLNKLS